MKPIIVLLSLICVSVAPAEAAFYADIAPLYVHAAKKFSASTPFHTRILRGKDLWYAGTRFENSLFVLVSGEPGVDYDLFSSIDLKTWNDEMVGVRGLGIIRVEDKDEKVKFFRFKKREIRPDS